MKQTNKLFIGLALIMLLGVSLSIAGTGLPKADKDIELTKECKTIIENNFNTLKASPITSIDDKTFCTSLSQMESICSNSDTAITDTATIDNKMKIEITNWLEGKCKEINAYQSSIGKTAIPKVGEGDIKLKEKGK